MLASGRILLFILKILLYICILSNQKEEKRFFHPSFIYSLTGNEEEAESFLITREDESSWSHDTERKKTSLRLLRVAMKWRAFFQTENLSM